MISAGDSFGSYKVVRKLGQGGMGEVWLLESASGRKVAAKFLDSASAGDHEARRRFLREAQLAIDVKHPNLVETYDVGEDPDTGLCYILMEYVSGGSLEDYLKKQGALPIADAVAVVEAMAGVLEIARQKGIVHRDIKPANIMFSADGTPKLADLGIARGGSAGTETTTVTQTGVMIGTPAYMAPEQMLDSHNVDTRADIYSLGIVFFEMLTGERPNKDDTVVQLMAKAVKGEPLPDVRTLRPEVSASLAQLLAMMVAPDKEGRISTPGQITNALAVIERGGKFVSRAELERKQREAKHAELLRKQAKKRNLLVVSVVAVFVGLVAAVVLLAMKKSPQQQQMAVAPPEPVPTRQSAVVVTNIVTKVAEPTPAMQKVMKQPVQALPTKTFDLGKGVKMEFIQCPAGTFTMGAEPKLWNSDVVLKGGNRRDKSNMLYPRQVTISRPFWMTKYPVTAEQWELLMGKRNYNGVAGEAAMKLGPKMAVQAEPVESDKFISEIRRHMKEPLPDGFVLRLPTAAEMEYAFRSGGKDSGDLYSRVFSGREKISDDELKNVVLSGKALMEQLQGSGIEFTNDKLKHAANDRTQIAFKDERRRLGSVIGEHVANAWGFNDMFMESLCCERMARHAEGITDYISGYVFKDRETDPLMGNSGSRAAAFAPLMICYGNFPWTFKFGTGEALRLVIGPDLEKEKGFKSTEVAEVKKPSTVTPPVQALPSKVFDIGNGVKMEFVQCPAGTFTMGAGPELWKSGRVTSLGNKRDNTNMLYPRKVTISRPFWMAKYPVTAEQWENAIGKLRLDGDAQVAAKALGPKMAVYCGEGGHDRLIAWMNEQLKGKLPNGYVARLPTAAEIEYAFRTGGKDYGDVYSKWFNEERSKDKDCLKDVLDLSSDIAERLEKNGANGGIINNERTYVKFEQPGRNLATVIGGVVGEHKPNAWGIHDLFMETRCLDKLSDDQSAGYRAGRAFPDEAVDPLVNEGKRMIFFTPRSCIGWLFKHGGAQTIRLVIGPDLEKEKGFKSAEKKVEKLPTKSYNLGKGIQMEFVECPAGTFTMGAGPKLWKSDVVLKGGNRRDNSNMLYPRKVTISRPFWMAKYPVTAEQWELLMGKRNYKGIAGDVAKALGPKAAEQRHYRDCQNFMAEISQKLKGQLPKGYVIRLPTAAEMEYTFRSGGNDYGDIYSRVFSDGEKIADDEFKKVALSGKGLLEQLLGKGIELKKSDVYHAVDSRTTLALDRLPDFGGVVGVHVANAWGLHDMFMESTCADRSAKYKEFSANGNFPDQETDPYVNDADGRNAQFAPLCMPPWLFKGGNQLAIRVVIGPDLKDEDRPSALSPVQVKRMQDKDGWSAMRKATETMFKGWRVCSKQQAKFPKYLRKNNTGESALGYLAEYKGVKDVLRTYGDGDVLERPSSVPIRPGQHLRFMACSENGVTIMAEVDGARTFCDGHALNGTDWEEFDIDLSKLAGKKATITLNVAGRSSGQSTVQWHGIEVK